MMYRIAAFIIFIAVVVGLYNASKRPDTFRLSRSVSINAPAEKIFPLIVDLQKWKLWSPYENLDSRMQRTYAGPPSGTGASYSWHGNMQVGAGTMGISEAIAPSLIKINLVMTKPMAANNLVEFKLQPDGTQTIVSWTMSGPAPFINKLIGMLFSDAMVKKQFDEGLGNLKRIAEQSN